MCVNGLYILGQLFPVVRQVAPVNARQPLDQALWQLVVQKLLLLGMGYTISICLFNLWDRTFGKVWSITFICAGCTLESFLLFMHPLPVKVVNRR